MFPHALFLLILASLAPVAAGAQSTRMEPGRATGFRRVVVELNGRRLLEGIAVSTQPRATVLIPVAGLAHAIDGPDAPGGSRAGSSSRLRIEGTRLSATAPGGCDECPVRVTRSVVISTRLRITDGSPAFPLADLVAAFEGRLDTDSTGTIYTIHAGRCTWCILEPAPSPSIKRSTP